MFLHMTYILIIGIILNLCNSVLSKNIRNGEIYHLNENRNVTVFKKEDFNFQCRTEVPTILLEYDRRYNILNDKVKEYFSAIMICCPGYKRDKYDKTKCVPDCDDKCENGFCIEPNRCQCFDGYIMNSNFVCVQTCPISCMNGTCKKDGTCRCNYGYELDYTGQYCRPICNDCGNHQVCIAPNECACMNGYKLSIHGCVPKCDPDCGMGQCTAPNECTCANGYDLKNGVCQYPCYQVCDNGRCIGVNHCVCNPRYSYDQRSGTCIPHSSWIKDYRIE